MVTDKKSLPETTFQNIDAKWESNSEGKQVPVMLLIKVYTNGNIDVIHFNADVRMPTKLGVTQVVKMPNAQELAKLGTVFDITKEKLPLMYIDRTKKVYSPTELGFSL
jgi:hypothetical protein